MNVKVNMGFEWNECVTVKTTDDELLLLWDWWCLYSFTAHINYVYYVSNKSEDWRHIICVEKKIKYKKTDITKPRFNNNERYDYVWIG